MNLDLLAKISFVLLLALLFVSGFTCHTLSNIESKSTVELVEKQKQIDSLRIVVSVKSEIISNYMGKH